MKTPPFLSLGSTICLIAPSFGVSSEPYFSRLEQSIRNFTRLGYQVKVGPNVYLSDDPVASASAELRAKEFNDAYLQEDCDLILSVGGGEVMDEILPYVDFEAIKSADPKWFMGFSDNTNLAFLLPILSGVKAIYGPNAPSFYERRQRLNQLDALNLLSGASFVRGYPKWSFGSSKDDPPLKRVAYRRPAILETRRYDGEREGTLIGGCLDCIVGLVGTRFDRFREFAAENGKLILFLECCDLTPLGFRRALFQLREAGYLDNVSLLLFGRPLHYGETAFGMGFAEMAEQVIGGLGIPTVYDCPLGHLPPSMPFIEGARAKVGIDEEGIYVRYIAE